MSYDLARLELMFRRDLQDELEPFQWAKETIWELLDESQEDFTSRVNVLLSEISVNYTADDTDLVVPDYVTSIRSAQSKSEVELDVLTWREWQDNSLRDDYGYAGGISSTWRSDTGPEPKRLITDLAGVNASRMHPIPTEDGWVRLQVYHTQITRVVDGYELEVVQSAFQKAILLKAESEAFKMYNMQTYDPKKAEELRQSYEVEVLRAHGRVERQNRSPGLIQYGGL